MTKTPTTADSLTIGDWFQVHSAGSIQKLADKTDLPGNRLQLTDKHGNVWQGPRSHAALRVTL